MRDRIRPPKDLEEVLDMLKDDKVFDTKQKGMMFAAAVGYCLHRELWGQGLITEAARALVDAGFRTLDLHRVAATCDVRNTASFVVMEKLGMRREACFRRDRQIKGEWRDTYLYAVLAEEWLGTR